MPTIEKKLYDYRELMATLAWKNIALRYKQPALVLLPSSALPLHQFQPCQRAV